MKKGIIFILSMLIVISMFVTSVNAATSEKKIDPEELGVKKIGTAAKPEDYNGTGIVNLRCSFSSWDKEQSYLWLISNWSGAKGQPASLKLGEYDMSQVKKVEFDYVTDVATNINNVVSLTKDEAGTQKVATIKIAETTGNLANPKHLELAISDTSYKGPLYIYLEYDVRMFAGNFTFTIDDTPPVTTEPETTTEPATTTNPQTSDNSVLLVLAVIFTLGAGVIKKRLGYAL